MKSEPSPILRVNMPMSCQEPSRKNAARRRTFPTRATQLVVCRQLAAALGAVLVGRVGEFHGINVDFIGFRHQKL